MTRFDITDTFGIVGQPQRDQAARTAASGRMYSMTRRATLPRTLEEHRCSFPTVSTACRKARCSSTPCSRATRWRTSRGRSSSRCKASPASRSTESSKRRALAFQQQIHFDSAPDSPQLVYRLATPVPANWTPLAAGARPAAQPGRPAGDPARARGHEALLSRGRRGSHRRGGSRLRSVSRSSCDAQDNFIERPRSAKGCAPTSSIRAAGSCGAIPRSR